MTSLFPAGAGGQGPKGPVREPLHPDERDGSRYAPKPPSERGREPEPHRGVGVFRFAGCGLGVTLALVLLVGVVIAIGYLRDDPGRNPAPAGYRDAVCAGFSSLEQGTQALERGVAATSAAERNEAWRDVVDAVADADAVLTDLPAWDPGRSLDELLGSQIITLTNGAAVLRDGDASIDLEIAREVNDIGHDQLANARYGFTCSD